ncbi:MAG: hypothetical protein D6717_07680 [Gammaproteobacteria bacterium]|nr:MAG: hypothetical protein D6717_07680 [Gammaproteobacteria bacterium]
MHRFGRYLATAGALLSALGLIVGFTAMIQGHQQVAKFFLMLTPLGFVALLAGVVTTFLVHTDQTRPPE